MKKDKAFTLTETLITLSIIAVIATLTIATGSNSKDAKIKRNKSTTSSFYSSIDNIYQQVIFNHGRSGSIADLIESNATTNSETLRTHFLRYLDGNVESCDTLKKFKDIDETKNFINDNLACFSTSSKLIGGFYLGTNKECTDSYSISEFSTDDTAKRKTATNVCGYIIYGPRDSKGEYGVDLFTIALGKRGLK